MNGPDRCLARKFKVIREPGEIPKDMENVFVPLEVICGIIFQVLVGEGIKEEN